MDLLHRLHLFQSSRTNWESLGQGCNGTACKAQTKTQSIWMKSWANAGILSLCKSDVVHWFELLPSLGEIDLSVITIQLARLHFNKCQVLQIEATGAGIENDSCTHSWCHHRVRCLHVWYAWWLGSCESFSVVLERSPIVNQLTWSL